MDAGELGAAIHEVATLDDPVTLTALAARIRRDHPGDPEADTVARQAELKRRRLIQEA